MKKYILINKIIKKIDLRGLFKKEKNSLQNVEQNVDGLIFGNAEVFDNSIWIQKWN